jgi:non-heme chloroperoxidase
MPLSSPAAINFSNPQRAPRLLSIGDKDHISPPALNMKVLKLQRRAPSVTESKEYVGRPHLMAATDGWEDIADDALNRALEQVKARTAQPVKAAPA